MVHYSINLQQINEQLTAALQINESSLQVITPHYDNFKGLFIYLFGQLISHDLTFSYSSISYKCLKQKSMSFHLLVVSVLIKFEINDRKKKQTMMADVRRHQAMVQKFQNHLKLIY